ncbi:MAG: hypothetical protein JW932_06805 [Deltaproteobacteria bacterium]|nr:hypothetical protein [Deltaproteobacteria bacterium]
MGASSQTSAAIAEDIANVRVSAEEILENSTHVNARAGNLKNMAAQLNEIVGRFTV